MQLLRPCGKVHLPPAVLAQEKIPPYQSGLLLLMHTSKKNMSIGVSGTVWASQCLFQFLFLLQEALELVHEGSLWGTLSMSWQHIAGQRQPGCFAVFLQGIFSSLLLVQVLSCWHSDHTGGAIFCSNSFLCWLCSGNSGLVFDYHKKKVEKKMVL